MSRKILIVDDEVQLLKVLKKVFMKSDYHIFVAESGNEALELLAVEPIDMIITDLRMPGMDGYELLSVVKRRYPDVIRIVLSGYADEKMIYQLFKNNLTKMCIYKPWDNASLIQNINQIFELNHILTGNRILQVIKNLEQLPVMNNMYGELCELMDSNAGIDEIERLLMKDQSIVASILHIANSAFFHINTGSLKKAIAYLGLNQTKNIVLVASITNSNAKSGKLKSMYELFSTHSVITNKICNMIYKDLLLKEIPPDNSCIGLLHGIGRMVLMDNFASQYEKIIHQWRAGEGQLYQIEMDALGVCHQELSGYLLDWWGLPYSLVEPILYHHAPWEEGVINKELTFVLYVADYYAMKFMKEPWPEILDEKAFEYLGFKKELLESKLNKKLSIS